MIFNTDCYPLCALLESRLAVARAGLVGFKAANYVLILEPGNKHEVASKDQIRPRCWSSALPWICAELRSKSLLGAKQMDRSQLTRKPSMWQLFLFHTDHQQYVQTHRPALLSD